MIALHAAYIAAVILAISVLLIAGAAMEFEWCRSVFRAWDYLGAALLGGDGKHSISAYCGAGSTWYHRLGRWAIDGVFGAGHCEGAARKEGLLA